MVVSSAYLRSLIFLLAILIPACDLSSPAYIIHGINLYTNIVVKYGFQCFLWRKGSQRQKCSGPQKSSAGPGPADLKPLWSCLGRAGSCGGHEQQQPGEGPAQAGP